jgi:hypothetical protein
VAPVPVDQAAAADREAVRVAGATAAAPADQAAVVAREAVRAAGATAAADPVRVRALAVTDKDMLPGKVARVPVATQGHGTLSVVAVRDRSLTPTPVASG